MNGLQIKQSTNFTFTAEIPYNLLLFSMPIDEFELGPANRNFHKSATNNEELESTPNAKHADVMAASSRKHVNKRSGDTVKCRLDAG